jgi:hypothetical protein
MEENPPPPPTVALEEVAPPPPPSERVVEAGAGADRAAVLHGHVPLPPPSSIQAAGAVELGAVVLVDTGGLERSPPCLPVQVSVKICFESGIRLGVQ